MAESAETPKELYSRCEANARVADRNTYERALSFLAGVSTPATYKTVLYPLDLVRTWVLKPRWLQPKDDSSPSEVKLDDQFVASLQEAKAKLEDAFCRLANEKKRDDYHAARVLPQEDDMDQLLRYDRALQKLLESQQRRRKAQAPQ